MRGRGRGRAAHDQRDVSSIFTKLGLPDTRSENRRVLAALKVLGG